MDKPPLRLCDRCGTWYIRVEKIERCSIEHSKGTCCHAGERPQPTLFQEQLSLIEA